jgi:hypothetical protein
MRIWEAFGIIILVAALLKGLWWLFILPFRLLFAFARWLIAALEEARSVSHLP